MKDLTPQEVKNRTQYNRIMAWLVIGGLITVFVFNWFSQLIGG